MNKVLNSCNYEIHFQKCINDDYDGVVFLDRDGVIIKEKIYIKDIEIGKVLINGKYSFALIKFLDKRFDKEFVCRSENGILKIFIPKWLQSKLNE